MTELRALAAENWLLEQLRLASEEVAEWPEWKREELYARAAQFGRPPND